MASYRQDNNIGDCIEQRKNDLDNIRQPDPAKLQHENEQRKARPYAPGIGKLQSRKIIVKRLRFQLKEITDIVDDIGNDAEKQIRVQSAVPLPEHDPGFNKKNDDTEILNENNRRIHKLTP